MIKIEEKNKVKCIFAYRFEKCDDCSHTKNHDEIFENVLGKECGCLKNISYCKVGEKIYQVGCLTIH